MKKAKLLTVLSLGVISAILASCGNTSAISFARTKRPTEVLGITPVQGEPIVYQDEDGQVIVLNDPANDPRVTQVSSVKLNTNSLVLFFSDDLKTPVNETYTFEVKVLPYTAKASSLKWTSSNPEIASVSASGEVKALSEGTAVITVSTEDGLISDSCSVVVNDTSGFSSDAAISARNILKYQSSAEFKVPDPMYLSQRFTTKDVTDDVVTATSDDIQTMTFSKEKAYFRITADGTETLVENGSQIPSKVDYIFYTTENFDTNCLNLLNKHRLVIDQSHLASQKKTPYDALCEVLDSFFVSGSKIVTKLQGELTGFSELSDKEYMGSKYYGSLGDNSGSYAYYQEQLGKTGRADQEDEEEMGIPVGSKYTVDDKLRYLWVDNLVSYKSINEKISYQIGEKKVYQLFDITYQYKTKDVELLYPDVSKYTTVADIFEF